MAKRTEVAKSSDLDAHVSADWKCVHGIWSKIRAQESWTAPTLLNSWANYGGGYNPAGYFKDSLGIVHLRGFIKDGTVATAAFTLPAGYRPAYTEVLVGQANDLFAQVIIETAGNVKPNIGSNVWFSLDGISFRAA